MKERRKTELAKLNKNIPLKVVATVHSPGCGLENHYRLIKRAIVKAYDTSKVIFTTTRRLQ